MASLKMILTLSLWLSYLNPSLATKLHFRNFYPQLRPYMHEYLRNDCAGPYNTYLEDDSTSNNMLSCKNCTAAMVTGCLLHAFKEVDKANMASAAVILGILPTSLSLAGSTTTETGLLSLRRPVLAFLLGAGAPAVNPTRTFNYGDPKELMARRFKSMRVPRITGAASIAVLGLEYALAMAAITNLAIVSWQLCVRTVCSFAEDTIYLPALWAILAAAIHIVGATAVALRVQLYRKDHTGRYKRSGFGYALRNEFSLGMNQASTFLDLDDESYWFLGCSWCVASGTVVHIIFGTLVFSSTLFITTLDAVVVVFQLLASTLVCRMILMFELSGMRQTVSVIPTENLDARRNEGVALPPLQKYTTPTTSFDTRKESYPLVPHRTRSW